MRGIGVLACVASLTGTAAFGQPDLPEAQAIDIVAAPGAVTAYVGRASVTRSVTRHLPPGLYDLRFTSLPEALQPDTIQARARGPVAVLGVEYSEQAISESDSPHVARLDARIDSLRGELEDLAQERALIDAQEDFIEAVTTRAARAAGERSGTADLDLRAVREQIEFVGEERAKLMERRRAIAAKERDRQEELAPLEAERSATAGAARTARSAIVALAVHQDSDISVDLSYLVANATWQPRYSIRAAADGSGVTIEYNAFVSQRTGEDWYDVEMTLSTARPTIVANPPVLEPIFLDELQPDPAGGAGTARRSATIDEELAALAAEARIEGAGPSVSYALPRPVTVRTDAREQQRTRIATISARADFVHVALPPLTDSVYVRGDLANASAYQLLPGPVSIFIGPDYVGPTALGSVPPGGGFAVHFGIDPAVTTKHTLVTKKTSKTGLLGGGRRTDYEYRVEVANGAGKTIRLELHDRIPASRTDKIEVQLVDPSHPLATDAAYLEDEKPQGLLKWMLNVPPDAPGARPGTTTPLVLTYGVRVVHSKDLEMTDLPE